MGRDRDRETFMVADRLLFAALLGTAGKIEIVHREERGTVAQGKTVEFERRSESEEP